MDQSNPCQLSVSRPLSPHLSIYKTSITMMMSIMHRITGVGLYFGIILVCSRVVALACSEAAFDFVAYLFSTLIGRLISFFYIWVLLHHMLGGIRHLIQDLGYGFDSGIASRMAWVTLFGSLILASFLFFVVLFIEGLL